MSELAAKAGGNGSFASRNPGLASAATRLAGGKAAEAAPTVPASAPAPATSPAPPPTATPTPPAPAPPPPKPAVKAEPATPAPAPEAPESKGIKEVRAALERTQARLKELEATEGSSKKLVQETEAKIATMQQAIAAKEQEITQNYKPQIERLSTLEKELQQAQEQLRIKDYTSTPEWHKAYVKPIADARAEAEALMSELEVKTEDGGTRPATRKEFDMVLGAPNLNQAMTLAKAIFGDDFAQTVVNHRNKIISLERNRHQAQENAALESTEYMKRMESMRLQQMEKNRKLYLEERARLEAEEKEALSPAEEDSEWKDALLEAAKDADRAVAGDPNAPPEDMTRLVAKVRSRSVAAAGYKVLLKRQATKIAELESRLKAYESSEPDVSGRTTPTTSAAGADETATSKLMKAADRLARGRH